MVADLEKEKEEKIHDRTLAPGVTGLTRGRPVMLSRDGVVRGGDQMLVVV